MLQKPSSGVLASLNASTYRRRRQGTYPLAYDRSERSKRSLVCTSSAFHLLRPCPVKSASWLASLSRRSGRAGVGRVRR